MRSFRAPRLVFSPSRENRAPHPRQRETMTEEFQTGDERNSLQSEPSKFADVAVPILKEAQTSEILDPSAPRKVGAATICLRRDIEIVL